MQRFENKTVVVTGASRGLGQAIVLGFAKQGAHVIGLGVSDNRETAEKVAALGGKFTSMRADLSVLSQADARALVAEILTASGRVDVLVNNAGIIRRHPAAEFPEEDWNVVLQVNLTAPFFLCQAVASWWLGGGHESSPAGARLKIVNIASMLSSQGGILVPAYTAAKSGIAGVTKALACEWAKERININAVAPGYIATENTQPLRDDETRNSSILARIPEGRWGEPEDIAGTCVFLASPEADYLNGAVLNVDGGWLAR